MLTSSRWIFSLAYIISTRVGGREKFEHCNNCGLCLPKSDGHKCRSDISKTNCPVRSLTPSSLFYTAHFNIEFVNHHLSIILRRCAWRTCTHPGLRRTSLLAPTSSTPPATTICSRVVSLPVQLAASRCRWRWSFCAGPWLMDIFPCMLLF